MGVVSLEEVGEASFETVESISMRSRVEPALYSLLEQYHGIVERNDDYKGFLLNWDGKRNGSTWWSSFPSPIESGMSVGVVVYSDFREKVVDGRITPVYARGVVFQMTDQGIDSPRGPVEGKIWNNLVPCKRIFRRELWAKIVYIGTSGEKQPNPVRAMEPYVGDLIKDCNRRQALYELTNALDSEPAAKHVKKHFGLDSLGCVVIARCFMPDHSMVRPEDMLGSQENIEAILDELCGESYGGGHELSETYVERLSSITLEDINACLER